MQDLCHVDLGLRFEPAGKRDAPHFMAARIREHPGPDRCRFMFATKCLGGAGLVREDLDAICPDAELVVLEEGVTATGIKISPKRLLNFAKRVN